MRHLGWLACAMVLSLACGTDQTATRSNSAVGGRTGAGAATSTTISIGGSATAGGSAMVAGAFTGVAGWVPTDIATEHEGPWNGLAPAADKAAQQAQLGALATMTTDELMTRSSGAMSEPLGYAPETAKWMDLIQGSALALNDSELATYKQKGFVISNRQSYPNFLYGYKTIYAADLPVYISADAILNAVHRSYDDILANVEDRYLSYTLGQLLIGLRGRIAESSISDTAKHDLGLLLGVAAGLLSTTASSIDTEMMTFINKATTASGAETVSLFGRNRMIDFSQFLPRGHYAHSSTLSSYFRAMMWLGRIELRLVDVKDDGSRELERRELEDVLALQELMTPTLRAQWDSIDQIVGLFVGEPDYMTLPQVETLRSALGITASVEVAKLTDAQLLSTIDAGGYGVQRICSQLMVIPDQNTTLPNSFALLGQRYTVDSHVFTKVVFPNTAERRMMPNPLDVAFAALGNDQAAPLLRVELDTYKYAPNLGQARQLVEWHGTSYWDSSLYTLWLSALRQVSASKYDATTLPGIARTEAWGRRLLNTQLGSWAELRHDTLLYVKQSYTGIPLCEYPDGYVDPYPGLFARLRQMGTIGAEKLAAILPRPQWADPVVSDPVTYFVGLAEVAGRLEILATEELTGAPRSADDLAFLNDAVTTKRVEMGCTFITVPTGWYARLFYDQMAALEADPTIADVHTQPADEGGNVVGRVLHVATGNPRLMVVSVDSCDGPRAYAGVVSAYFEQITDNFVRKTDQAWTSELTAATPADVPWMRDLVVR